MLNYKDLLETCLETTDTNNIKEQEIEILNKNNIYTIEDLLSIPPKKYIDKFRFAHIPKLLDIASFKDEVPNVGFVGMVENIKYNLFKTSGLYQIQVKVKNYSTSINVIFFTQKYHYYTYLRDKLKLYSNIMVLGKITHFLGNPQIVNPKFFSYPRDNIKQLELVAKWSKIQPKYKAIGRISSIRLEIIIDYILNNLNWNSFCLELPSNLIEELNVPKLSQIIWNLHRPLNLEQLKNNSAWLEFFESYKVQKEFALIRQNRQPNPALSISKSNIMSSKVLSKLQYCLTKTQKKAYRQICRDMKKAIPMQRLLEGNTGSGKTIISILSSLNSIESGKQVAFITPSLLLSRQHFNNYKEILSEFKMLNIELLNSSTTQKERIRILKGIESGEIDIVIGTHSLFNDKINFKNLGLVIVDEQHKFGLDQRQSLRQKYNSNLHYLSLSATPIPRTLALEVYGDLNISYLEDFIDLDNIDSRLHDNSSKESLENMNTTLIGEIKNGNKGIIVVPRIEKDIEKANKYYEKLLKDKNLKIGILHGKMSKDEKERIISSFENDEIQLLISTSVIEVGIDIPKLTFIAIFNATHFSASSLHQIRGRVGRDGRKSYCYFGVQTLDEEKLTSSQKQSLEKVKCVAGTKLGKAISRKDLEIRGEGDILGTKQSGKIGKLKNVRLSNKRNLKMLEIAKKYAEEEVRNIPIDDIVLDEDSRILDKIA